MIRVVYGSDNTVRNPQSKRKTEWEPPPKKKKNIYIYIKTNNKTLQLILGQAELVL